MPEYSFKFSPLKAFDTVFFDGDGTLSAIEGIDYLAALNHREAEVSLITQQCMASIGITAENYAKRLTLIKPTFAQLQQLQHAYLSAMSPDAKKVIALLQQLHKTVYVISAGIRESLLPLSRALGIPAENVFAVEVNFDSSGNYEDFDTQSPLVTPAGKSTVIQHLLTAHQCAALIGDGANDLEAKDTVERFIGYGGAFTHTNVLKQAPYFLKTASFLALLPLLLTKKEATQLGESEQYLFQQGFNTIKKEGLFTQGTHHV